MKHRSVQPVMFHVSLFLTSLDFCRFWCVLLLASGNAQECNPRSNFDSKQMAAGFWLITSMYLKDLLCMYTDVLVSVQFVSFHSSKLTTRMCIDGKNYLHCDAAFMDKTFVARKYVSVFIIYRVKISYILIVMLVHKQGMNYELHPSPPPVLNH